MKNGDKSHELWVTGKRSVITDCKSMLTVYEVFPHQPQCPYNVTSGWSVKQIHTHRKILMASLSAEDVS